MNIKVLRRVVIAKIVEACKNVYKSIMLISQVRIAFVNGEMKYKIKVMYFYVHIVQIFIFYDDNMQILRFFKVERVVMNVPFRVQCEKYLQNSYTGYE